MNLNAPTMLSFGLAAILALVGLLGTLGIVGAAAGYAFWLAFAGWAVLALGTLMKGF